MGGYSAIADASQSVLEMLRDRIETRRDVIDIDRNEIVLASPNDVESDSSVRLSLYLFKITKNEHLNNASRRSVGNDQYEDPPLALDLHYLLTAYPAQNQTDDAVNVRDQHSIMGLAMQVLYDNTTIEGDELQGSLKGEEKLQVSMDGEANAEIEQIWKTFVDESYQPSVIYEVSPVTIESMKVTEIPAVTGKDIDMGNKAEEEEMAEFEADDEDEDTTDEEMATSEASADDD